MDRCPIDIWNIIFTFACTDGGITGRSLSLTSRDIHDLSKPFKLQSLVVTGAKQILSLARLLADIPPKYRRVRHLFIGDDGDKRFVEHMMLSYSYGQWKETNLREQIRRCQEPTLDAYLHIIKETAPTLLSLVVHFISYTISMSLPDGVLFPSLVELSLYGHPIHQEQPLPPVPEGQNTDSSDHPPLFPSLRYLYLTHDWHHPTLVGHITRVAPLLTHLSLPQRYPMTNDLPQLLGIPPPHGQSRDDDPSSSFSTVVRPLNLKWLLIDQYYPYEPHVEYKMEAEKVEAIAEKDDRVYVFKQRRPATLKYAEMYWWDRMEGGDGVWAVPLAL